jgi:hypothetical protein
MYAIFDASWRKEDEGPFATMSDAAAFALEELPSDDNVYIIADEETQEQELLVFRSRTWWPQ